jgi:hypothetical protein
LTTEAVPRLFVGPLTKDDAALESDVSADETRHALDDINRRSAPGPDGLPPALVVNTFGLTALVLFLARFLTRCFRAVYIPTQWRTSENFILYKGAGPVTDVSSFRAISLTQILAKVYIVFCLPVAFVIVVS